MEFKYLIENGQIFVSEEELDRLCEETGLYEDEVLTLVSEATSEEKKAEAAQKVAELISGYRKEIKELRSLGTPEAKERAEALERVVDWFDNPSNMEKFQRGVKIGSIGVISLGALALAAGGVALVKKLKKNKAKKEAMKAAQAKDGEAKSEDVMIDYFITEDGIIFAQGMDFILESFDYEVSEEDICQAVLENKTEEESIEKTCVISEELLSEIKLDAETIEKLSKRQIERANNAAKNSSSDEEAEKAYQRFGKQQERLGRYIVKSGFQPVMKDYTDDIDDDDDNDKDEKGGEAKEEAKRSLKDKAGELAGKAKNLVIDKETGKMTTGAKIGAGALAASAIIGGGAYVANKMKKRKAKKAAEVAEKAAKSEDLMIEFFIEGQNVYIDEADVDLLIECSDYILTEQDIADIIVNLSELTTDEYTIDRNASVGRLRMGMDPQYGSGEKTESPENKEGILKKVKGLVINKDGKMTTGSKIALGATAVTAGGLALSKVLKDRKAKKANKEGEAKSEDVMINYVIAENSVYVTEDSLDFLLEETDFELTEEELFNAICEAAEVKLEIPGDGVKVVTSEKELAKVKEKQEADMKSQLEESTEGLEEITESLDLIHEDLDDVEDLLEEALEMLEEGLGQKMAEGRVRRAERKLKRAKMNRQEMSRIEKEDDHRKAVELAAAQNGKHVQIGGRQSKPRVSIFSNPLTNPMAKQVAKNIARDKYKADIKIEKAQRKLDKAKQKLGKYEEPKSEAVELVIPGNGVKPITSEKELVKVPERQTEDIKPGPDENKPNEGVRTNGGEIAVHESAEYDEFAETWEGDHIIMEAVLEDMDIELSESEMYDMIDRHLLSERSIVKLDKQAKRSHAEKKALMVIAREQNDPLYKKLDKLYKQRRAILNQLDEKYGSRAIARVRSAKTKAKQMKDE